MRRLIKPTDDALNQFRICIRTIRDVQLKNRLESISSAVSTSARAYDNAAVNSQLHTISPMTNISGVVTKEEMESVYTQRMAKKGHPGRILYNKLMAAPAHGKCPLCGIGHVKTLDHHLAKNNYPIFAVTPFNLVPACFDCNKAKLALVINSTFEQTIHPYYDDIESIPWLSATINETIPPSMKFKVDTSVSLSNVLIERIKFHFRQLGLGERYAVNAAQEFENIRHFHSKLFASSGELALRENAKAMAESYERVLVSSWQAVFYKTISKSAWYTSGRFIR